MDLLDLAQGYPYINIVFDKGLIENFSYLNDFIHYKNFKQSEVQNWEDLSLSGVIVFASENLTTQDCLRLKKKFPYCFILSDESKTGLGSDVLNLDFENQNELRKVLNEIDQAGFKLQLSENQVEWLNILHKMNKEAKDYLTIISKEILSQFKTSHLSQYAQEMITFFKELADLRHEAFSCSDHGDFFKVINTFLKKWDYLSDVGVDDRESLYKELSQVGRNYYYVPIPRNDEFVYLRYSLNSKKGSFKYVIFVVLFNLVDTYLFRDQLQFEAKNESMLLDLIFKNFPYPLALITDKGDLLAHNKSFERLDVLPNRLLSFENDDQLMLQNIQYDIQRIRIQGREEIHQEVNLFVLCSIHSKMVNTFSEAQLNGMSNEQLGIISSSIAHELKNPIAGILAAIDYLLIADEFDSDIVQDLQDMKESSKRCRELIEIFLGFSRANTNNVIEMTIEESFKRAITLMSFRMVESHCMLEFPKYQKDGKFIKKVNPSVLAMIFYLALNETLTEFAHFRLISPENAKQTTLKGELVEKDDSLEIKFPVGSHFLGRVEKSKLLQHLCDFANLSLEVEDNKIKITEWRLRS